MLKSTAASLILRGVLALLIGILALAWPGVTVLVLVIMFAVYAFTDVVLQAMRAFASVKAGPVPGHLPPPETSRHGRPPPCDRPAGEPERGSVRLSLCLVLERGEGT